MTSEFRRSLKEKAKEKLGTTIDKFRSKSTDAGAMAAPPSPGAAGDDRPRPIEAAIKQRATELQNPAKMDNIDREEEKGAVGGVDVDGEDDAVITCAQGTPTKGSKRDRMWSVGYPNTKEYVCSSSDTVSGIAAQHNITVSELKKLNRLMSNMLFPGQVLFVPDPDGTVRTETFGSPKSPEKAVTITFPESHGPGIAQPALQPSSPKPRVPSEETVQKLIEENTAQFIKVDSKYITDGKGFVSGTLLVTTGNILFDPNMSDPVVKEMGSESFSVHCKMDLVVSVGLYRDIACMKLGGEPEKSHPLPTLYHPDGTLEESHDDDLNEKDEASQPSEPAHVIQFGTGLEDSSMEVVPRPAQATESPMYLCVKDCKPTDTKHHHINPRTLRKERCIRSEYWFSVPKDQVDNIYAFLRTWKPEVYGDFDDYLEDQGFYVNAPLDFEVIEDHYGRKMSMDWQLVSTTPDDGGKETDTTQYHPPELLDTSCIMLDSHIKHLCMNLPARSVGNPWRKIFDTSTNGFSLKSLYRSTAHIDNPVLLVVQDTEGQVCGALLSMGPKLSEHFYGTGESYLFTFVPEFKKFNWTGENNYFVKGNTECLIIGTGTGSFGLWLDSDLYHGRTQPCLTFGNEPLLPDEDFICKALEAWTFA